MSFFSVDIYTPSKVVARNLEADSVKVSTCRGEINVLPEHTHLITQLTTGLLSVHKSGKDEYFTVSSGVLKVLKGKITILTQESQRPEEIDQKKALQDLDEASKKINSGESLSQEIYQHNINQIRRAQAQLDALKFKKK